MKIEDYIGKTFKTSGDAHGAIYTILLNEDALTQDVGGIRISWTTGNVPYFTEQVLKAIKSGEWIIQENTVLIRRKEILKKL